MERGNLERETGRRRRSRMENLEHRVVLPHWLRETLDGRYLPGAGGADGGNSNNHC